MILDAAVRVFAAKGYHTCRVGDIAEEAGIAHGLLYHYFASKEEVLETVFRENWSQLLEAFARIEESAEPPLEQLGAIAKVAAPLVARPARPRPRDGARGRAEPAAAGQVDEIAPSSS